MLHEFGVMRDLKSALFRNCNPIAPMPSKVNKGDFLFLHRQPEPDRSCVSQSIQKPIVKHILIHPEVD